MSKGQIALLPLRVRSEGLRWLAVHESIDRDNAHWQDKLLNQANVLGGLKYEKSERTENPAPVVVEREDISKRARRSFWEFISRNGGGGGAY